MLCALCGGILTRLFGNGNELGFDNIMQLVHFNS